MASDTDRVAVSMAGGVATVELNRPERSNAIDLQLRYELAEVFEGLAHDEAAHAVVLSGRGKNFCAGGDMKELGLTARTPEEDRERVEAGNRMIRALVSVEAPVVAAVRGAVAGAGIALCLAADVVVASDDATLHFAFLKMGLGPDAGTSMLLANRVGTGRAKALLLQVTSMSAADAARSGIVDEVVPVEEVDTRAAHIASELSTRSRPAVRAVKNLMFDAGEFEAALEAELDHQVDLLQTPEHRDARAMFMAKRERKQEVDR